MTFRLPLFRRSTRAVGDATAAVYHPGELRFRRQRAERIASVVQRRRGARRAFLGYRDAQQGPKASGEKMSVSPSMELTEIFGNETNLVFNY